MIRIVGAGFAGLTTAFELIEAGHAGSDIEIYEASERSGGLLQTTRLTSGPAEAAANAILSNALSERTAQKIGLELVGTRKQSRNRYIFRARPRRWPLTIGESIRALGRFVSHLTSFSRYSELESLADWARRSLGEAFARWIMGPALQGVYASSAEQLNASAVLGRFMDPQIKAKRRALLQGMSAPKLRGSVAPAGGMGAWTDALEAFLKKRGVHFHFQHAVQENELAEWLSQGPVVWATSLAALQQTSLLPAARDLPVLNVGSATLFFDRTPGDLAGFGCLFPAAEKFSSLGVLFNEQIFSQRGDCRSETWIFRDPSGSDTEWLESILRDRRRLRGDTAMARPRESRFHRWPHSLPLYGPELAQQLRAGLFESREPEGLYFVGNFTGGIGLAQIHFRAFEVARKIRR